MKTAGYQMLFISPSSADGSGCVVTPSKTSPQIDLEKIQKAETRVSDALCGKQPNMGEGENTSISERLTNTPVGTCWCLMEKCSRVQ